MLLLCRLINSLYIYSLSLLKLHTLLRKPGKDRTRHDSWKVTYSARDLREKQEEGKQNLENRMLKSRFHIYINIFYV